MSAAEPLWTLALNRLFDSFLGRSAQAGTPERTWAPVADMYETIDERVIQLDLQGMNEKGVQVSITADLLSVKGQRRGTEEAKPEAYYSAERWTGKVERMFQVPISVKADKVRASYQDGVLTVRLPKVEAVKPKEIRIDVS